MARGSACSLGPPAFWKLLSSPSCSAVAASHGFTAYRVSCLSSSVGGPSALCHQDLPPTPVSAKSTTRYQQCPLATPATPPPSALPSCHGPRPTPRQAACRRSPLVWRSYRLQPSHPGRCASSCRRRLGVLPPLWPVGSFRHREPPSRPCSEPVHTHGREGQGHTAGTPAKIPSSNPSCSPASVSLTEREAAGFTDALG